MKVKELMTPSVIRIRPEEPVSVAARSLTHYNIGMLPVCGSDGKLRGVVTDRDIVTRCLAAGRSPEDTQVGQIMTTQVHWVDPEMDASLAASVMGSRQVRRLPVVEKDRVCGMLSLGDLAGNPDSAYDASDALTEITSNLSSR